MITAKEQTAALIGAGWDEIYMTSGGSEADNWVLRAVFELYRDKGRHLITSSVEHPAILRTCEYLEREYGASVTYIQPDREGVIRPEDVEAAIRDDTILISVMCANNEIGTIEPVRRIAAAAAEHHILFHTDAVQAVGQIPLDVRIIGADFLSASAHKLNGPKGCGCLYIRRGTQIGSLIHGGAQERNRRAGTENVAGIVGFGAAAERARRRMQQKIRKELCLQKRLISGLRSAFPDAVINGAPAVSEEDMPECGIWDEAFNGRRTLRLPGNVNVSFPGIPAETLLIMLDRQGICASAGSACSSGSLTPSHVLKAIGLSDALARSTVRFSLSEENTEEEIDTLLSALQNDIRRLRMFG